MDGSVIYRDVWQLIVLQAVADDEDGTACLARLASWKRVCRQWRDWMTDDVLWQPLVDRHGAALRALRAWNLWTNEHRPTHLFKKDNFTGSVARLQRFYRHYATQCHQGRQHVRLTAAGVVRLDSVLGELAAEDGATLWSAALALLSSSSSSTATWFDLIAALAEDQGVSRTMMYVAARAWAAGEQDPYEAILALVYFRQIQYYNGYGNVNMTPIALEGLLVQHGLLRGTWPATVDRALGLAMLKTISNESIALPRHYWDLETPLECFLFHWYYMRNRHARPPRHLGDFLIDNGGPIPPAVANLMVDYMRLVVVPLTQ